jgi:hypothetical protein
LLEKDLQLRLYPAIVMTLVVALLFSWFGRLDIAIQIEPTNPSNDASSGPNLPLSSNPVPSPLEDGLSDVSSQIAEDADSPFQDDPALQTPTDPNLLVGRLRVSNRTDHPVRVALVARQAVDNEAAEATPKLFQNPFSEPAQWDFAPDEGHVKGLILSLPDQSLQIKPGDILVAFAQDGSRRYWGPFVVGESSLPSWNNRRQEWQLILDADAP